VYSLPTISTKRTCGSCTACCISFPLNPDPLWWPEGKPSNTPCQHLCGQGCGVYQQRPEACSSFECGYLQGWMGQRPNETGVLFFRRFGQDLRTGASVPSVIVREMFPNALIQLPVERVRFALRKIEWEFLGVRCYDDCCSLELTDDDEFDSVSTQDDLLRIRFRSNAAERARAIIEWWK
jgi:hypothetical protein